MRGGGPKRLVLASIGELAARTLSADSPPRGVGVIRGGGLVIRCSSATLETAFRLGDRRAAGYGGCGGGGGVGGGGEEYAARVRETSLRDLPATTFDGQSNGQPWSVKRPAGKVVR